MCCLLSACPTLHPRACTSPCRVCRYSFFMVMCWNMNGMDSMSTLAMRVHRPGRTFPLAVSLIVPVVVTLYVLVILTATGINTQFNMYYTGYFAHVAGQGGALSLRTPSAL